jgi:hypothetical protein
MNFPQVQYEAIADMTAEHMITITAHLSHEMSGQKYEIVLTSQNDFQVDAGFAPGEYRLEAVTSNIGDIVDLDLGFEDKTVLLSRDTTAVVRIFIKNEAQVTRWLADMVPTSEILGADPFSSKVQLMGRILDVKEILTAASFRAEEDLVPPKTSMLVYDEDIACTVTVRNTETYEKSWRDCQVISVTFEEDIVIFPKGARLGLPISVFSHAQDGFYGLPNTFDGSPYLAVGIDELYAIYRDPISGDSFTVVCDAKEETVTRLTYDFEVYE